MSERTNIPPDDFELQIGGALASAELLADLEHIAVESSLHLPAVATLVLNDPELHWIDSDLVLPGQELVLNAMVERNPQRLFSGEIVELEPDFGPYSQRLVIRAFNRLHRLSRGKHVRTFQNVTDSDLVEQLAAEVGLQPESGPTNQVHAYVLQANESNLAFLQRRAAALGYLVYVDDKTLHFKALAGSNTPISLQWGDTLNEFRPRLTTLGQVSSVMVRGWDPASKRAVVGEAQRSQIPPTIGESAQGGDLVEQAFRLTPRYLVADRPVRSQVHAEQLAQAVADRQASRFVEAEGLCTGIPALQAGTEVQIDAVGDRFSGRYLVTAAIHCYDHQGYTTAFSVSGLNPATLFSLLLPEPAEIPQGGLVVAIVTDNQDPDKLGRVKVKFPWLSEEHTSDWVRVVAPGAGKTRGIAFLPEIDDEVLVGFELGDLEHPYVLGGLWNGRDTPWTSDDQTLSSGQVRQRIVRSRTGHRIVLDDDRVGGITIEDAQGNRIVLQSDKNRLLIEVQGDMLLQAGGKIEIAGQGITIDGGAGNVDIQGQIINLN